MDLTIYPTTKSMEILTIFLPFLQIYPQKKKIGFLIHFVGYIYNWRGIVHLSQKKNLFEFLRYDIFKKEQTILSCHHRKDANDNLQEPADIILKTKKNVGLATGETK